MSYGHFASSTPLKIADLTGFTVVADPNNQSTFAQDVTRLVATGSKWARVGIQDYQIGGYFGTVGAGGQFFWTDANVNFFISCIQQLNSAGIKINLTLAQMSNNSAWTLAEYITVNRSYWNKIAQMVVAGGGVSIIQVYNEHDVNNFRTQAYMGGGLPTSTYLADLSACIQAAREELKALLPTVLITSACSGVTCDDNTETRWTTFYDGIGGPCDVIGLNCYPGSWIEQINNLPLRFARLRARYNKQITVQEIGVPTEVGGVISVATANSVLPMMINTSNSAIPASVMIYQLRNKGTNTAAAEENFGIFNNDGTKRETYNSVVSTIDPTINLSTNAVYDTSKFDSAVYS